MSLMQKITDGRPNILWAETAALLHDIGKLSKAFLDYRQNWRKLPNGWDEDPHDHEFLRKDALIKDTDFTKIREWFNKTVTVQLNDRDEKASIEDVIDHHIALEESYFKHYNEMQNSFLNMVKAADSKDAALDRNNPLFSADQKGDIFATDVFGAELKSIQPHGVEKQRAELYTKLGKIELPNGKDEFSCGDRITLLKTVKEQFDEAFSDTTRPDNDTTLWEHSYAVASILKVLLVHQLIYGETLDHFGKVRFGIWGIGWDSLSFLSNGHKIADIMGRKDCIDELKREIKVTIEYKYLLGNTIYEDDNGIFFLIPRLPFEINLEETDFDNLS